MQKEESTKKNDMYWQFNLPLQYWPSENGELPRILNYMPRRQTAEMTDLELEEQTHEEFFNEAAHWLDNLAAHFRQAAKDPSHTVYYHDKHLADPPERPAYPVNAVGKHVRADLGRIAGHLVSLKDSLDGFVAPPNAEGWSLSNLPAHFWETLGECIEDLQAYEREGKE